jgi:hypothetical protein
MFWKIFIAVSILIPVLKITNFRPLPIIVSFPGLLFKNSIASGILGFIYGWALSLLLFMYCSLMYWYFRIPLYLFGLYNSIVYLANASDLEMKIMIKNSRFMRVMNYSSVTAFILQMILAYATTKI